ncbi:MAG: hypothetical protein ABSG74_12000 [Candidatus Bathyarchaeia archaeon]|jgi:amino acid transporter
MAKESGKKPTLFAREATGLVREAGFWDTVVYNILPLAPGIILAYQLFWIPGTFPGGSIVGAMIMACVLAICIATPYGLLSMAMPRTSADYVATSRIIHPGIGLGSSLVLTWSSVLSAGYYGLAFTWWAVTPAVSVIGVSTGNSGLVQWGATLSTFPYNFIIGALGTILSCVVIAAGMRRLMIYQNILFIVGMIGMVIMAAILITTPQSVFITQFNQFALPYTKQADSYHYIIQQAAARGMQYPGTYTWPATVSVLPAIMASGMWTWFSVAQTGEVKGAATRRHWYTMILAAVIQYAILIVMVLLIFNTIGEQFISSANFLYSTAPDVYAIPVAPMLPLLAGLIPGGIIIPCVIVLTFLTWTPLIDYIQLLQPVKALFAWSFDRILPEKVSDVNERTHSPLYAITICGLIGIGLFIWASAPGWGAGFFQLLIIAAVAGNVTISITGITAILFPYVKRDLYKASAAKIEVLGIPLCVIAGVITVLVQCFLAYMYLTDLRYGMTMPVQGAALNLGLLVVGVVIYYIAKAIRTRQGINLDYLFKEVPPE